MTPFTFINAINGDKDDLFADPQADKDYVAFIVNRTLSYFPDTVFVANAVNRLSHMPNKAQYDFLRFAVNPRKRFAKWAKKDPAPEDLDLVCKVFNYNRPDGITALELLSADDLAQLRQSQYCGGK